MQVRVWCCLLILVSCTSTYDYIDQFVDDLLLSRPEVRQLLVEVVQQQRRAAQQPQEFTLGRSSRPADNQGRFLNSLLFGDGPADPAVQDGVAFLQNVNSLDRRRCIPRLLCSAVSGIFSGFGRPTGTPAPPVGPPSPPTVSPPAPPTSRPQPPAPITNRPQPPAPPTSRPQPPAPPTSRPQPPAPITNRPQPPAPPTSRPAPPPSVRPPSPPTAIPLPPAPITRPTALPPAPPTRPTARPPAPPTSPPAPPTRLPPAPPSVRPQPPAPPTARPQPPAPPTPAPPVIGPPAPPVPGPVIAPPAPPVGRPPAPPVGPPAPPVQPPAPPSDALRENSDSFFEKPVNTLAFGAPGLPGRSLDFSRPALFDPNSRRVSIFAADAPIFADDFGLTPVESRHGTFSRGPNELSGPPSGSHGSGRVLFIDPSGPPGGSVTGFESRDDTQLPLGRSHDDPQLTSFRSRDEPSVTPARDAFGITRSQESDTRFDNFARPRSSGRIRFEDDAISGRSAGGIGSSADGTAFSGDFSAPEIGRRTLRQATRPPVSGRVRFPERRKRRRKRTVPLISGFLRMLTTLAGPSSFSPYTSAALDGSTANTRQECARLYPSCPVTPGPAGNEFIEVFNNLNQYAPGLQDAVSAQFLNRIPALDPFRVRRRRRRRRRDATAEVIAEPEC